jgi:endonuclease YncB( thermonuclease family)
MRRILPLLGMALLISAPPCLASKWRTFENCTLVPNESNDGDSFHVKVKRREYIFRLYFADTPETDMSFPDRVAEQADYWGIGQKAAVRLGHQAANFTRKFLADGFTVYTKMDDARGRSDKERFYAIVMVGEKNLSEELVRNGLARIFGQDTDLPDGTRSTPFWWRLKTAEREAKKNRLGAFSPDIEAASAEEATNQIAPPPLAAPILAERDVVLAYTIPVFSMKEPFQQIGNLQRGAQVRVLGAESASMVRIRFTGAEGRIFEAQCRRVDLGL